MLPLPRVGGALSGALKGSITNAGHVAIRLDDRRSLRPHAKLQPIIDAAVRRALQSDVFFTAGVAVSLAY